MKSYEILEKALGVIEDPNRWTRGAVKDDGGGSGDSRFCAIGALIFAAIGDFTPKTVTETNWAGRPMAPYHEAKETLARLVPLHLHYRTGWWTAFLGPNPRCAAIETFNDSSEHAQVVALFKNAIRAEKARHGVSLNLGQQTRVSPTASEYSPEPVLAHV